MEKNLADIIKHPDADYDGKKTYEFSDGSSIIIKSGEPRGVTAAEAIYMLDDVKYRIHKMMHGDK